MLDALASSVRDLYEVQEWRHATAILRHDFPEEWKDLMEILSQFRLRRSHVEARGGGKSPISKAIEGAFNDRGWIEKRWDTEIKVDAISMDSPTHKVDCYRNRVALEIEWSNKDPFFDRDLNNFRLLFDLRAISVGVIITKSDELRCIFEDLNIWGKYGTSTTWMSKLRPRIEGGGGGGCPILVFGITRKLYGADL